MTNKYDLLHGFSATQEHKQQIIFVEPTQKEKLEQKVSYAKSILIDILWAVFGGIGFTLMIASAISLAKIFS